MPRIIGIGGKRVIDIPMPANNRMTVRDLRDRANISNQYSLARVTDDGCPEELNANDYILPEDNIQVFPKHIRG